MSSIDLSWLCTLFLAGQIDVALMQVPRFPDMYLSTPSTSPVLLCGTRLPCEERTWHENVRGEHWRQEKMYEWVCWIVMMNLWRGGAC